MQVRAAAAASKFCQNPVFINRQLLLLLQRLWPCQQRVGWKENWPCSIQLTKEYISSPTAFSVECDSPRLRQVSGSVIYWQCCAKLSLGVPLPLMTTCAEHYCNMELFQSNHPDQWCQASRTLPSASLTSLRFWFTLDSTPLESCCHPYCLLISPNYDHSYWVFPLASDQKMKYQNIILPSSCYFCLAGKSFA